MKSFISLLLSVFLLFGQTAAFADEITPYKLNIQKLERKKKDNEVPQRTFKKFTPYKITVNNISNSEFEFELNYINILLENGEKEFPVKRNYVYKKSKGHPLLKASAIGIPVGAATLGFLLIPTFATTFALAVDANNTLKKDIEKLYFEKKVLKPSEEFSFYIFVPKNTPEIKKIILN